MEDAAVLLGAVETAGVASPASVDGQHEATEVIAAHAHLSALLRRGTEMSHAEVVTFALERLRLRPPLTRPVTSTWQFVTKSLCTFQTVNPTTHTRRRLGGQSEGLAHERTLEHHHEFPAPSGPPGNQDARGRAAPSPGVAAEVHASPTVSTAPTYSGPAPTYGGDPAIGETQQSYLARTGDQMPRHLADIRFHPGPGRCDSAPGETDDSPSRTPRRAASLAPAITNPITCAATER